MEEKILKLEKFLKDKFERPIQAFTTRNIVGDYMMTIYDEDEIIVDYAPGYNYIEIFGIEDDEYQYLENQNVIY